MHKVRFFFITVGICLVVFTVWGLWTVPDEVLAKKPGGNDHHIPVDIEFLDTMEDGTVTGVQSDEFGSYPNGGRISAYVGGRRWIWLYLKTRAGRTLVLDLPAPSCLDSVKVDVDDIAGCDLCDDGLPILPTEGLEIVEFNLIGGLNLDDMAVGSSHEDKARLRFDVGGDTWELWWGPYQRSGGWTMNPDSDAVEVTRIDKDTWEVQTTGNHGATLYRQENPPHRATEYHGEFTVPFAAMVTAQEPQPLPPGSDHAAGRVEGDGACPP